MLILRFEFVWGARVLTVCVRVYVRVRVCVCARARVYSGSCAERGNAVCSCMYMCVCVRARVYECVYVCARACACGITHHLAQLGRHFLERERILAAPDRLCVRFVCVCVGARAHLRARACWRA